MTAALAPAPSAPRVADDGSVRFLAAVTGVPDEVDDLIVPGAFTRTLRTRKPKIVRSHDCRQLVGRVTEAVELMPGDRRLPRTTADGAAWPREAGALLVRGVFNTASREGKAALDDVRFYGPDSASSALAGRSAPRRRWPHCDPQPSR